MRRIAADNDPGAICAGCQKPEPQQNPDCVAQTELSARLRVRGLCAVRSILFGLELFQGLIDEAHMLGRAPVCGSGLGSEEGKRGFEQTRRWAIGDGL